MNIEQLIAEVENKLEAIEDPRDLPVPGKYEASAATLFFQAGAEDMRAKVIKLLREGGFNVLANSVNDFKV